MAAMRGDPDIRLKASNDPYEPKAVKGFGPVLSCDGQSDSEVVRLSIDRCAGSLLRLLVIGNILRRVYSKPASDPFLIMSSKCAKLFLAEHRSIAASTPRNVFRFLISTIGVATVSPSC